MDKDMVERLVKAKREARSSMEWFNAVRAEQRVFFKPPASGHAPGTGARWRKIMDAVDLEMESEPSKRAGWDF